MDPVITGSLISAGSNLLGGLLGGGKPDTTPAWQEFSDVFDAKMRLADKHGISKLVMAGVPANQQSWQEVGGSDQLGSSIAAMGQDIGRAVSAGKTGPERMMTRLQLDNAALNNELLQAQIRSMNSRTIRESGPPRPAPMVVKGVDPTTMLKQEAPTRTTDWSWWQTDPRMPDTQVLNNRYGEEGPLSWGLGVPNYVMDTRWNINRAIDYMTKDFDKSAAGAIYDYLLNGGK